MLGINYFKAEPTEFVRFSSGGKVKKEGKGVGGFFLPYRASIELVPLAMVDHPFVFKEICRDNQEVTLNGGFLYRITDTGLVIATYDFSIDPETKNYLSETARKLPQNILELVQSRTRKEVQKTQLKELLIKSEELSDTVMREVTSANRLNDIGVKLDRIYFSSIRPKPEIAQALETEYREKLLEEADKATYSRRAGAVKKERAIQEQEMATKLAMAKKEEELVALNGANRLKEADYNAQATAKELGPYEKMDPAKLTARALLKFGENAGNLGSLTITSDLLAAMRDSLGGVR